MAARKKTETPAGDSAIVVTAPLVGVNIGGQVLHFGHGDILPKGVSEDSIKHLRRLGFVADSETVAQPDDAAENSDETDDSE